MVVMKSAVKLDGDSIARRLDGKVQSVNVDKYKSAAGRPSISTKKKAQQKIAASRRRPVEKCSFFSVDG